MSITVFLFIASCMVQHILGTIYTDYGEALTDLRLAKENWLAKSVTEYVYNFRLSCFCLPCSTVAKYIVIKDGAPTYVEYDATALDSSCDPDPFTSPLSNEFHDITHYYDLAIAHAEIGATKDCTVTPDDMYCGDQSIEFEFDATYYYPSTIRLVFNSVIADAGSAYFISCLTPLSDLSSSAPQCSGFTLPSEGDSCGTPGEDCEACDTQCVSCTDDSGLMYGCCSTCALVENSLGELLCSASIPQDLVCPEVTCDCFDLWDPYCCEGTTYGNSCELECESFSVDDCTAGECLALCGGVAGIACEGGFYCVDDPSDDCDPANGGADCGGICVSEGDSCDGCSGDRTALCACALCDDDSGDSYGCCGCVWASDGEGEVSCNGAITSKEDVCPDVVDCICTEEYDPYCCDGTVYSNLCGAGCAGLTADDCVEAVNDECPAECGGFVGVECDDGLVCVDDPTDDCDPENGGADCGGICVEETTTTVAETTTSTENGDYCDHFDNSASAAGFDRCKFCICREREDHPHCQRLYELYLEAADDDDLQSEFYTECAFGTYPDLANAEGEQCDWLQLRAKDAGDLTECHCSALYCNGNTDFPVDNFGSGSGVGAKQMSLSIAFVIAVFWWM